MCETRISHGLMINAGMLLASSRRLIIGGPAPRVNWEEFVRCEVRANETYSEAKHQFSDRNRDVLMNVQSHHKWWSTLKSVVFGSSSSLPPLVSEGGGLVCESVSKADLLSDHFDSRQSREAVDLQLTCHPSPSFTTFAFRSSEVRRLLLDLDPYGFTDPLGMFPLFLKRTADVMAPRLSVVFRQLVRLGSFPTYQRQANDAPVPKGPPSSSVANYRPISITSVLSKVFELLVSIRLGRFMELSGVLQPPSLLIGKVWVPVMHFCACPIHCRVHWRVGRRLGSCRLISVQPLIGSTIWAFSISSALWILEVLSCLY